MALVADAATWTGACAIPPAYGVMVWLVIGLSPSASDAVQLSWADCVPGRAITAVGADGGTGADGVTALEGADSGPEPFGLYARTRNV